MASQPTDLKSVVSTVPPRPRRQGRRIQLIGCDALILWPTQELAQALGVRCLPHTNQFTGKAGISPKPRPSARPHATSDVSRTKSGFRMPCGRSLRLGRQKKPISAPKILSLPHCFTNKNCVLIAAKTTACNRVISRQHEFIGRNRYGSTTPISENSLDVDCLLIEPF